MDLSSEFTVPSEISPAEMQMWLRDSNDWELEDTEMDVGRYAPGEEAKYFVSDQQQFANGGGAPSYPYTPPPPAAAPNAQSLKASNAEKTLLQIEVVTRGTNEKLQQVHSVQKAVSLPID